MARNLVTVLAVVGVVSGCSSDGTRDEQIYGAAGGAVLGGGIGRVVGEYTTGATLAGVAVGGVVGYALGSYGDVAAREKHAHATVMAAEDGKATEWSTDRGSHGQVTPSGGRYNDRAGRPCQALDQDVTIDERHIIRQVTACREADGTWTVTDYRPDKAD